MEIKERMKAICEMLGVEMGEEFNIKCLELNPYKFNECGLCSCYEDADNSLLGKLLTGELTIEKLHKRTPANWKPIEMEEFWFIDTYGNANYWLYKECLSYIVNNHKVFKTKKEALIYKDFMNMINKKKMSREEVMNHHIAKYYFCFDIDDNCVWANFCINCINPNELYFNDETIDELVENHMEDIKYYLFGID